MSVGIGGHFSISSATNSASCPFSAFSPIWSGKKKSFSTAKMTNNFTSTTNHRILPKRILRNPSA